MFCITGFCAGNSPVTAGNSPITSEFPSQRPVTWSFDVFFDLRLNNGELKRHRTHYDVTVMWCISDPMICAASFLSNFEFEKRVKLGGSTHYGTNGLKFETLLYPDYHSLKFIIFYTQWLLNSVVSGHPEISFKLGRK